MLVWFYCSHSHLNSSLLNLLQILYHSLPHAFLIFNSCTLIKFNVNMPLLCWWSCCCHSFCSNVGITCYFYCNSCWFLLVWLHISSFLSIHNYFHSNILSYYNTQFIIFHLYHYLFYFSFYLFLFSLRNTATSILFIILRCVFSYLLIFLDYIILSNSNWVVF